MAITYPRAFPAGIHITTLEFEPVFATSVSPLYSGETESKSLPLHFWKGTWSTLTLFGEQAAAMQAWLDSLKDGSGKFYGRDTQRCSLYRHTDPAALSLGGSAWGGILSATSFPALNQVAFTAPAGLTLVEGDLIEIRKTGWHHLARISEGVTAATETAITATFRPAIPAGTFSGGDTIDFYSGRVPMTLTSAPAPQRNGAGKIFTFSGTGTA